MGSGTIEALECPYCGAPITPSVARTMVACAYCRRTLVGVPEASWGAAFDATSDDAIDASIDPRRVHAIAGRRYFVRGKLASGESSDVFLADRVGAFVERVVLKVLRARADADLFEREWRAVHALHESAAQGSDFFSTLLPQPVARGTLPGGRPAIVYRWRSGFVHTLDDVARAFANGVDPRAAVWMWRRALELLGWVHRSGYVHGAVLPQHVLLNARDHGVVFVGWSCASVSGQSPIVALCTARRAFYPKDALAGAHASASIDIAMSARCIAHALGGDPSAQRLPASVPAPLVDLVRAHADGSARSDDAWSVKETLSRVAVECFGPSRYVPFEMPG